MPPEFLILAAFFAWTVVGSFRTVPRYVHWRGPRDGTPEEVQREHFRLFHDPRRDADEEFGS